MNAIIQESQIIDRAANALASLRVPASKKQISLEVWVSTLLERLPISHKQRHEILPGGRPALIQKLELLQHVPEVRRVEFFSEILGRALASPADLPSLGAVVQRAAFSLSTQERAALIEQLCLDRRPARASRLIVAILKAVPNLKQTEALIKQLGEAKLLERKSKELCELVATIRLGQRLAAISLPEVPSKFLSHMVRLQIVKRDLKETLLHAHAALQEFPALRATQARRNLTRLLTTSEKTLNKELHNCNSISSLNRALRASISRISLELRHGVSFTSDNRADGSLCAWSESELNTAARAFKYVNNAHLIFSGGLREMLRVETLPAEIGTPIGEYRESTKLIALTDDCFLKNSGALRDGASPEACIVHELGHALSLGWRIPERTRTSGKEHPAAVAIFKPDVFPEHFLSLGTWRSQRAGFKVDQAQQVVTLGDRSISLDAPVLIDGEMRVYQYDAYRNMLSWYTEKGEFPSASYGRSSPIENWAESFSDYHTNPRRLIEFAPGNFWYMEALYHRYNGRERILGHLKERLAPQKVADRRATLNQNAEPLERQLFRILSPMEQRLVLQDLTIKTWGVADDILPAEQRLLQFQQGLQERRSFRTIHHRLEQVLTGYNPAFLLARVALAYGAELALVSIRGGSTLDPESQSPLIDTLCDVLGPRFNPRNIYFLNDAQRSRRLGAKSYHEKLAQITTEKVLAHSIREPGHCKMSDRMYKNVYFYSVHEATLDFMQQFVRENQLEQSLHVIDVRYQSSAANARLLIHTSALPVCREPTELHIISIDETLIHLPAQFTVRSAQGGRVLRTIALWEYLLKEDPEYWVRIAQAAHPSIPKGSMVFSVEDFVDRGRLRTQLSAGREDNYMLRSLRQ